VQTLLVIVVFAVLGLVFWLVEDRKDADYWAGYTNAQHWVDDGGYSAHEESITDYCRTQAAGRHGARNFERGCADGAHNAMRPPR
jgi:hypothetical protein